jgi:two-component system, OmpR family, response regulator
MATAPRILVVDDDEDIRAPLKTYLQRYGFEVTTAHDCATARLLLKQHSFDLILLDVIMPGEDGLTFCRYVHEHINTPVILLSAVSDLSDRIAGLELGADDYVTKPFEPRELLARIRSICRRMSRALAQAQSKPALPLRYRFSQWSLDVSSRQLIQDDGQCTDLSATEFRLLKTLLDHANQVLSREQLMNLMRSGESEALDRSIDIHVSRLRKKLQDNARQPQLLRTAWGDGYILTAKVNTATP